MEYPGSELLVIKSKFLYQDADVTYLADKCIVVTCFVFGKYEKILIEKGLAILGSQKMDSCLVLTM